LLTDDFAFRDAVATNEKDTVISVLANHAQRVNANLVVLLSKEGDVEISTHKLPSLARRLKGQLDIDRGVDILTIANNQPHMLVFVPIKAPDLIGWVGLGFKIDLVQLDILKQLTDQDITLVFTTGEGRAGSLSTLDNPPFDAEQPGTVDLAKTSLSEQLRKQNQLTRQFLLLDDEAQKIYGVLSHSLTDTLATYNPMRLQMVVISLVALALAAITSFFIARGITQPIKYLVSAAHRISNGDYSKPVRLDTSSEFNALGKTLNLMQETVFEREERIKHQSRHDMLTQLPNRFSIYHTITNRIVENAPAMQFGIGLLNLNNLPYLTDLYGSEFSDQLLRKIAENLTQTLRRGDVAARVGDMQFLVFFEGLDHGNVPQVVDKLLNVFEIPITNDSISVKLEATIGFVLCPQHGSNFDDLLRRAQIAQKHCKSPKRFYSIYEVGQDEIHLRQIKVTNKLQHAIASRNFSLVYQPKFDLNKNRVTQAEALIRWTDSELGPMFPDEFITLAEHSGDITKISSLVVDMAIEQLLSWQAAGIHIAVSINLSGADIVKKGFITDMINRYLQSGLPSNQLVVEITESMMMADLEAARENLELIKSSGFMMSIDDFGTGFSSLAQLKMLPVSELKIDKSLIQNLSTNQDDRKIVHSTIEMAHHLGLSIVAEGVEDKRSVELLSAMGCDALQGYYLGKPMQPDLFQAWLENPPVQIQELSSKTRGVV